MQDKSLKKQVGLHEIEAIYNLMMITVGVNPKEYFEKYRNKDINKKKTKIYLDNNFVTQS